MTYNVFGRTLSLTQSTICEPCEVFFHFCIFCVSVCLTNSTTTIVHRTRLKVFACHSVGDVVMMSWECGTNSLNTYPWACL